MLTDISASTIPIALLGADALLAARPATPVQVLHACLAAGFAAAYPVSWGDELIARECLSRLRQHPPDACVLCACPHAVTTILREYQSAEPIAVASPPVAAARLVRGAYHGQPIRITYVGGCPSGADPALDAHVTPAAFLATLEERGIELSQQPKTFEGVLPPDRRRFHSLPGGCPDPDRLIESGYQLVAKGELNPLGDAMLRDEAVLFDVAVASGCVCGGAPEGRRAVAELEPPKAPHAIIDPVVAVDLSPSAFTAAVLATKQGSGTAASRVRESLGAAVIDFDVPASTQNSSSPPEADSHQEPSASLLDVEESVPEAAGAEAEPVIVADTPAVNTGDSSAPSHEPPPAVVESSTASREVPIDETETSPDDTRVESERIETPAAQRGYNSKETPLRSGPILEFTRPVFPRSESVYEDEPDRPRFSMTTVFLALALGLALPLAALGGWVLFRYGPGIIRSESTVPFVASDSLSSPSIAGTNARPLDSAAGAVTDTTTSTDSATSHTTSVDSASARRTARRVALPLTDRAASQHRSREETNAVTARPPSRQIDSAAARTKAPVVRPDTARFVDSAAHAAPTILPWDVDSMMRELAQRRARLDSLNRVVDSLKKPAGRGKPPK